MLLKFKFFSKIIFDSKILLIQWFIIFNRCFHLKKQLVSNRTTWINFFNKSKNTKNLSPKHFFCSNKSTGGFSKKLKNYFLSYRRPTISSTKHFRLIFCLIKLYRSINKWVHRFPKWIVLQFGINLGKEDSQAKPEKIISKTRKQNIKEISENRMILKILFVKL